MNQNAGKNGRPFILPDKIIEILARIRSVFNASFISLESYIRIFQEILGIPRISYTSIFRRIRAFRIADIMNPSSSVAIDSTGFKTTIRGDWISNKWAIGLLFCTNNTHLIFKKNYCMGYATIL